MPEQTTEIPISNAFARWLAEFRDGESLNELTEAMQECVGAARETNKPAELKFSIKFTPNGDAICVTDKIETKLPKEEREKCIFFPTEENTLQRDNPRQKTLDLRTVEKPRQEVVTLQKAVAQ